MRVSIQEAAHRLSVAESTIRRRIRNGELSAVQMSTPQGYTWLVELPPDLTDARAAANSPDKWQTGDPEDAAKRQLGADSGELSALRELVTTLQEDMDTMKGQLAVKDRQMEIKDQQIGELHVLLQQASLPAPRERRRGWLRWLRRQR